MSVEKAWNVREPSPEAVTRIVEETGCSTLVATILANRDLTDPEQVTRFLDASEEDFHDPALLPEMEAAIARLELALDRDENITVYADRDVDGTAGGVILLKLFQEFGATVGYWVPGKWDGYGLHEQALEQLSRRGVDLLITVDCGTTAVSELQTARELGMDVVVTDHHEPEAELPKTEACVNPRRGDSGYPHDHLAGGGVAFKLGEALVRARSPDRRATYYQYALPLACLSTLGDSVELTLENRAIAIEGFDRLFDSGLPGLSEVARYCGIETIGDVP